MDAMDARRESAGLARDIKVEDGYLQTKTDDPKSSYKSMKKKYRKMKIKFEQKMRQSNEYYIEEQQAAETAGRLAQENDRLLDLLLDVNSSAQIPLHQQIDLSLETPPISALPALVGDYDLSEDVKADTPASQAIYNEIRNILDEDIATKHARRMPKSLLLFMESTPHLSLNSGHVSSELLSSLEALEGHPAPISYLTPDQIDDYLYDIDSAIGTSTLPPLPHNPAQSPTTHLSDKDLALRNPNSVYNWLRRHEPKIFLQDGEGSEKSSGKPGALRGAGKRASIPAPSRPDTVEFVEEDGIGYDVSLSGGVGAKGKRKRDDDGGYRPKGGASRPTKKKKKSNGSGDSTGSKKSRGKGATSSPFAANPNLFGPA
jgi:hypothetical protein